MKRNYRFEPLTDADLDALAAKYPFAIETRTVVIRKPVYKVVAMLLERGEEVPGIRLLARTAETAEITREWENNVRQEASKQGMSA